MLVKVIDGKIDPSGRRRASGVKRRVWTRMTGLGRPQEVKSTNVRVVEAVKGIIAKESCVRCFGKWFVR